MFPVFGTWPVKFQAQQIETLIDSGSEVNAMTAGFAAKLGLIPRPTNVGTQKIDGSILETYGMALAGFLLQDSLGRVQFFGETFLLADISIEVVLGMSFLSRSNADFQFDAGELNWRSYTVAEVLSTASGVELIDKHVFAKAALGKNSEMFVVHVAALEAPKPTMSLHPFRVPLVAALQQNKFSTKIPLDYADYADVLLFEPTIELPGNTSINEHAIELVEGKQSPYGPIYSLRPVELETLKTYIETYLKTGYIRPSKSPTDALILFDKKPDDSLRFCVNY